jgi:hypothetical protein
VFVNGPSRSASFHVLHGRGNQAFAVHDIAAVEHSVAIAVENKLLRSKRPAELIKPSADSGAPE